jgi:hypothetical protein
MKADKPPFEYPVKLYVRAKTLYRYPADDKIYLEGDSTVRSQLQGDQETEVAVYQLVRVAKFKRVVTEVIEDHDTPFKKLTTEVVEEL